MKIEGLSDNNEVEVKSRTYLPRILIAAIALLIFLKQAFFSWDENKLKLVPVIFPIFFWLYIYAALILISLTIQKSGYSDLKR